MVLKHALEAWKCRFFIPFFDTLYWTSKLLFSERLAPYAHGPENTVFRAVLRGYFSNAPVGSESTGFLLLIQNLLPELLRHPLG
jgi:hypothetical protein